MPEDEEVGEIVTDGENEPTTHSAPSFIVIAPVIPRSIIIFNACLTSLAVLFVADARALMEPVGSWARSAS